MVAATSNVVDFAMQNQSNAALTLGCVSIAGVLTYKAAAAVLPTVKKVVMVTAVVTAGGVAFAFSQDSSLVMTTAEVWGRNGVDYVLEHPAYTLVASAGLVLVVPKLVRSLVLPLLGVAGLAAAASHPSETLAIAKTCGEWALDHPRLILAAAALLISPYLLLIVVLGGVGYALLEGPGFMVQLDEAWHSVTEAIAHPFSILPTLSSSLKQATPIMDELAKGGDLPYRAASKPVTHLPPLQSLPSLRDLYALPALPKPDLSALPNLNEGLQAAAEKTLAK